MPCEEHDVTELGVRMSGDGEGSQIPGLPGEHRGWILGYDPPITIPGALGQRAPMCPPCPHLHPLLSPPPPTGEEEP